MRIDHSQFNKSKSHKETSKKSDSIKSVVTLIIVVSSITCVTYVGWQIRLAWNTSMGDSIIDNTPSSTNNSKSVDSHQLQEIPENLDDEFFVGLIFESEEQENKKRSQQHTRKEPKKVVSVAQPTLERNYALPSTIRYTKKNNAPIQITHSSTIKLSLSFGISSNFSKNIYAKIRSHKNKRLKNAQIIGQISGYEGNRLFIDFSNIKFSDGSETAISAYAMGMDKQIGVKGAVEENVAGELFGVLSETVGSLGAGSPVSRRVLDRTTGRRTSTQQSIVKVPKGTEFYLFFNEDVRF